jgi:hypothetical protein
MLIVIVRIQLAIHEDGLMTRRPIQVRSGVDRPVGLVTMAHPLVEQAVASHAARSRRRTAPDNAAVNEQWQAYASLAAACYLRAVLAECEPFTGAG